MTKTPLYRKTLKPPKPGKEEGDQGEARDDDADFQEEDDRKHQIYRRIVQEADAERQRHDDLHQPAVRCGHRRALRDHDQAHQDGGTADGAAQETGEGWLDDVCLKIELVALQRKSVVNELLVIIFYLPKRN